jgi:hypothetical protein
MYTMVHLLQHRIGVQVARADVCGFLINPHTYTSGVVICQASISRMPDFRTGLAATSVVILLLGSGTTPQEN